MRFIELILEIQNPRTVFEFNVHVLRLDEPIEKSNLSALPFSRPDVFVLQQVPIYLTPERASELAIVSAHRREEPALNGGGDGGGGGDVDARASLKPHNVSKNRSPKGTI